MSSKSKRDKSGKYKAKYSTRFIVFTWIASIASLALLYFSATVVTNDFASFRSCNSNSSGLSIHNCGKQSVNVGDLALLLLFILAAGLSVSLFTLALRITKKVDT